jgi:hypothetical protein
LIVYAVTAPRSYYASAGFTGAKIWLVQYVAMFDRDYVRKRTSIPDRDLSFLFHHVGRILSGDS